MFEQILQSLHAVQGVQATIVFDGSGKIIAQHAHAVYTPDILEYASQTIIASVDSVQIVHDDWEFLTASFAEGKVLLRNLRLRQGRTVMLAVIADSQLNKSFAGVAMRVAAAKLKAELEAPAASTPAAGSAPTPRPLGSMPSVSAASLAASHSVPPTARSSVAPSASAPPAAPPRADVAGSGLSWSLPGQSGASGVAVADAAAAAILSACTKALSASVGPMAKVFVKEAVRRVCTERPFGREDGSRLLADLERHIENPDDLVLFKKAMQSA